MDSATKTMMIVLAVIVVSLLVAAWSVAGLETGELKTERRSVEAGGAESASVQLNLGVGNLKLHGGAAHLMDAAFTYNVPEWKPEVEYSVNGSVGKLSIRQPKTQVRVKGKGKNEWDIGLKNDFPLSVSVDQGVGNSELDLDGLCLTKLTLECGVGNTSIRLAGDHPQVGDLDLECGVGQVDLDLSGRWKQSLDAKIEVGTGGIKIRVPRDAGVRVVAEKGVGRLNMGGLRMQDDAYVNGAYGKSSITLSIKASTGVGEITLTK